MGTLEGSSGRGHTGHSSSNGFAANGTAHNGTASVSVSVNGNLPKDDNKVSVVLGAQWGDEGKGKLVDLLASDADIVCRCQVRNALLSHFPLFNISSCC